MQPYFFPYLGYFDLIHCTDRWILFDTAQYMRHGWVNRNRILHPNRSWQYIIVPLQKHARDTPICDIHVSQGSDWRRRIMGQLDHYRKAAPFFRETVQLVCECFATDTSSLARINGRCLQLTCSYLGITLQQEYLSEMELGLGDVRGPGDWALQITKATGYKTYVNPVGGRAFLAAERFAAQGVKLHLRPFEHLRYECHGYQFEPGLSILDVLMWNHPTVVRDFLDARRQL